MNDNDIIKALECCVGKSLKRYLCMKCPLRDRDCYGGELLMPAVLELINRQKAEIERLQTENAKLRLEMSYMKSPNAIGDTHEMGAW